jgi:hypothetical protein
MKNKINVAYIGTLTNQSEYEKAFHARDKSLTVFKNVKEMRTCLIILEQRIIMMRDGVIMESVGPF